MRSSHRSLLLTCFVGLAVAAAGMACDESGSSDSTDGGAASGGSGASGGAGASTGGSGADAGTQGGSSGSGGAGGATTPMQCPVQPSACSDGKDNDNDGKVDAIDPECVDPCDNDEATFATGIPGDNRDDLSSCKQDCFFDGNSGADEGWQFPLTCDPQRATQTQCKYDPNMKPEDCMPKPTQVKKYEDSCRRITPNGCDCFGCCNIPAAGKTLRLTSSCTPDAYNDPTKCQPCTQQTWCLNDCKECELCVGKTTLPSTCMAKPQPDGGVPNPAGDGGVPNPGVDGGMTYPPMPEPVCDPGIESCGPGGDHPNGCPTGLYCVTGCCVRPID